VATYGTVARLSGLPGQARLVGYTLHALPPGMAIPWQRVVNAEGRISLKGKTGQSQRLRLEEEGIAFVKGRIDLNRFGWTGRGARPPARKRTRR
jgi:methylated-DNA-protein-cysteine methyltransferase-like protein